MPNPTAAPDRSYRGSDGQMRRTLSLGAGDTSPTYRGAYDSRCPSCWAGFSHTEALHSARVEEERRQAAAHAERLIARGYHPESAALATARWGAR